MAEAGFASVLMTAATAGFAASVGASTAALSFFGPAPNVKPEPPAGAATAALVGAPLFLLPPPNEKLAFSSLSAFFLSPPKENEAPDFGALSIFAPSAFAAGKGLLLAPPAPKAGFANVGVALAAATVSMLPAMENGAAGLASLAPCVCLAARLRGLGLRSSGFLKLKSSAAFELLVPPNENEALLFVLVAIEAAGIPTAAFFAAFDEFPKTLPLAV